VQEYEGARGAVQNEEVTVTAIAIVNHAINRHAGRTRDGFQHTHG